MYLYCIIRDTRIKKCVVPAMEPCLTATVFSLPRTGQNSPERQVIAWWWYHAWVGGVLVLGGEFPQRPGIEEYLSFPDCDRVVLRHEQCTSFSRRDYINNKLWTRNETNFIPLQKCQTTMSTMLKVNICILSHCETLSGKTNTGKYAGVRAPGCTDTLPGKMRLIVLLHILDFHFLLISAHVSLSILLNKLW